MSGGNSSGSQAHGQTKDPHLRKLGSPPPSESAEHSNQSNARSQAQRPPLVPASVFPKSSGSNTSAFVLDLSKHLDLGICVMVFTPVVRGAPDSGELEGVQFRRCHYFWPRSLELLADGAIVENLRRRRAEVSSLLHLAPHLDTAR
jgi:hypothetical protein